jgi:hypothetical protein
VLFQLIWLLHVLTAYRLLSRGILTSTVDLMSRFFVEIETSTVSEPGAPTALTVAVCDAKMLLPFSNVERRPAVIHIS